MTKVSLYDLIMGGNGNRVFTKKDWKALGLGDLDGDDETIQAMLEAGYESMVDDDE